MKHSVLKKSLETLYDVYYKLYISWRNCLSSALFIDFMLALFVLVIDDLALIPHVHVFVSPSLSFLMITISIISQVLSLLWFFYIFLAFGSFSILYLSIFSQCCSCKILHYTLNSVLHNFICLAPLLGIYFQTSSNC